MLKLQFLDERGLWITLHDAKHNILRQEETHHVADYSNLDSLIIVCDKFKYERLKNLSSS